jgi:hypothetical protein
VQHVGRFIRTLLAVAIVAVPTLLVDPSFGHYAAQHPWVATAVPLALAAVRTVLSAWQDSSTPGPLPAALGPAAATGTAPPTSLAAAATPAAPAKPEVPGF